MSGATNFNTALKRDAFPHQTDGGKLLATTANLKHLLTEYGINCSYDVMLKEQTIKINADNSDKRRNELHDTSIYSHIKSLLALNTLPTGCIDLLPAIFEQSQYNPIIEFITSATWDGKDRIDDLISTLVMSDFSFENDDWQYKKLAITTWLIQCVAAADNAVHASNKRGAPKFELVLVLQGSQGVGKTSWFRSLLPKAFGKYIIDGAHLDPADKDSVKKAISCWICELGELDATFRRADIARLKAFLSSEVDSLRLPYDRVTSTFCRRSSFGASVNAIEFLVDSTGNRRFLPIQVDKCERHTINMQQLWAQVWHLYTKQDAAWWCSTELEQMLQQRHEKHTETNSVDSLIADCFDVVNRDKQINRNLEHLTITQILRHCGITVPNKEQIKQAKAFLEKKGFAVVKSSGIQGYWIAKAQTYE
jgi:putative DNA primase/helicase